MNAKRYIAAAAMFVSAAGAFAAEAPVPAAAAASATASAPADGAATPSNLNLNLNLNLPTLGAPSHSSRDESKAGAIDFVKNYKTALSVQLDQYKN